MKINCDQIAWLNDILDRYKSAVKHNYPDVSRLSDVARIAAILEIMETLGLEFEDDTTAGNAISGLTEFNILRDN